MMARSRFNEDVLKRLLDLCDGSGLRFGQAISTIIMNGISAKAQNCEHCLKGQLRFQAFHGGPFFHYYHPIDRQPCTAVDMNDLKTMAEQALFYIENETLESLITKWIDK